MATIQDRIELADGVSPTLKRIINASADMEARLERMGTAANTMSNIAESAVSRFSPSFGVAANAVNAVIDSVETVNEAVNRADMSVVGAAMAERFGAVQMAAEQSVVAVNTLRTNAKQAAAGVSELGMACNQIHAPPEMNSQFERAGLAASAMNQAIHQTSAAELTNAGTAANELRNSATRAAAGANELSAACNDIRVPSEAAKQAESIGSAAERAVERTRNEVGEFSAVAMQTAQSVMQIGVACDKLNVPPNVRTEFETIATSAARLVECIDNTGMSAAKMKAAFERTGASGQMENLSIAANTANQSVSAVGNQLQTVQLPAETLAGIAKIGAEATFAAEKLFGMRNAADQAARSIQDISETAGRISAPIGLAGNQVDNINGKLNETKGILGSVKNAITSAFGQFTLANIAAEGIMKIFQTITEAPGKLAGLSDAYSGIMARLNLVTGSQEQAAQLNDQIYYAALRARGGYADMADAVSKIAMTAKEAFPNPKQVVPFMEGVQKLFAIGGTDAVRQKDALLQLTQALGSGRLQGDEFRSIAEAAPLIEQMVAKYKGVLPGELKELSSQGKITALDMKNAILGSLDEIDAQMALIPLKWSDIWQNIGARSYNAFIPVFEQVSRLANTPIVQKFADGTVMGMQIAAAAVLGLINNIEWLAGVFSNLYTQYQPVMGGIGLALLYVAGVWAIYEGGVIAAMVATATWAAVTSGAAAAGSLVNMLTGLIRLFTALGIAETFAQMKAWEMWFAVLAPIAGVAAAVYLVYRAIEAITGSSQIAASFLEWLGAIAISFFTVYAAGWATAQIPLLAHIALLGIKAAWDLILTAYAWMLNAAIVAQNATLFIGYVRMGLMTAATALWALVTQGLTVALRMMNLTMLANPIGFVIALVAAIIIAFGAWAVKTHGLRNTIADVFESIVDICETGVNIMIGTINGLISIINKATEGLNSLFGSSIGQVDLVGKVNYQDKKKALSDIIRTGTGDDILKLIGLDDILPKSPTPEGYTNSAIPSYDDLLQSSKDTADNTKGIKDAMDITDEDIKYLRDAAEQEAINKYTTAEIKIDMGGVSNTVNNGMDLDGVINDLASGLVEAMSAGAEAVHQ